MLKPRNIFIILLIVVFGGFIFLEATAPKPIDWSPSYWRSYTKPYGAKVFDEIFTQNQNANTLDRSIYEELTEEDIDGNILFFNTSLAVGKVDAEELLNWISDGNTAFISAEYISRTIIDTLELDKEQFNFNSQFTYKPSFKFDTLKRSKSYAFDRNLNVQYFKNLDTLDYRTLGYSYVVNNDSTIVKHLPNFIKVNFGQGHLFLHLFPQAFTNYFLVNADNAEYTKTILGNLNYSKDIYVDQYYKDQKQYIQKSVLQYLLTNKYLKWAYYVLLVMTIIYIVFEGKRKQQAIRIVKPYVNKTYEFTNTIAEMYYSKNDHLSIATKQIEHFLHHVREVYRIPTNELNDEFVKQLASKSGKETKVIKTLLKQITTVENARSITKEQLIKLEKIISHIKS